MTLEENNVLCSCYWSCQFMVYSQPLLIAVVFIVSWCVQLTKRNFFRHYFQESLARWFT